MYRFLFIFIYEYTLNFVFVFCFFKVHTCILAAAELKEPMLSFSSRILLILYHQSRPLSGLKTLSGLPSSTFCPYLAFLCLLPALKYLCTEHWAFLSSTLPTWRPSTNLRFSRQRLLCFWHGLDFVWCKMWWTMIFTHQYCCCYHRSAHDYLDRE